ncbi:MAG: tRNA (adenosine(37)-N6)-threonylcarbamoyltransferase complex ATPase subunit type 1 TsaE [Gammaproteobacteria bacterium]
MSAELHVPLADADATERLGERIAAAFPSTGVIYLQGELGAGKTTLTRGILRGFGFTGPVKSPTYTLIEPYLIQGRDVFHLDLYRIRDPLELEYLGLRDLIDRGGLILIEWPERGTGELPPPDWVVRMEYSNQQRIATIKSTSEIGEKSLGKWQNSLS